MKFLERSKLNMAVAIATATISTLSTAAVIEEVIVTASKRAQSAQDLGIAVSAFSEDDINDLGLEKPTDLAAHTPGLSTANATSGGTPIFAIRGIGLDDFNINNTSGVGVYIDEVHASSPMLLGFQLLDVERVEVLKGPQGTLYGKNTTGGAINFVTTKPTEDFSAELSAGIGRWNRYELGGVINGAITETVNGRIAFSHAKQNDGWQTDIDNQNEYGKTDKTSVVAKLSFVLSEDTDALLNVHYGVDNSLPISPQNDDSEARANDTLFLNGLFDGLLDVPADSESVRVGSLGVDRDEEGYGASFTVKHEFESITLTSITAFESYQRDVIDNYDGTAAAFLDLDQSGELEQFSQELRLTSDSLSDYSWVAGINYAQDEVTVNDTFLLTDSAGVNLTTSYVQDSTSWGLYFHNEYQLNDEIRLIGGLRYSRDNRTFIGGTQSADGSDFLGLIQEFSGETAFTGQKLLSQNGDEDESKISGKLGLDYQLSDDVLIYLSAASSYKAGLFYGGIGTQSGVLDYVEPEEVKAYELGLKSHLLDGALQLNGALYQYDYTNRQSLVIVEDPVIFLVGTLANVPSSTITGAELDFQWRPTDQLSLRGGVSYIDSQVDQEITTQNVRGLSLFSQVPAGSDLSQAPQWSYNFLVSYEWHAVSGFSFKAQADYTWVDEQFAALADPQAQYGEIESLGGKFIIYPEDEQWEFSLWGKNLGNEASSTYSFTNNSGARSVYRQQPRSYGLSVKFYFE